MELQVHTSGKAHWVQTDYGIKECAFDYKKDLESALKLKELIKKEAHEQVGTPWGFKLQSLVEESEK